MYQKLVMTCAVAEFWLLMVTGTAHACSCSEVIYPKMPRKKLARLVVNLALRQSEAVFSGEVIQIINEKPTPSKFENEAEVRFRITEGWKGELGEEVVVLTPVGCCGCNFSFKVGERYLVYAYRVGSSLHTDACTRTVSLVNAKRDLQILRQGKAVEGRRTVSLGRAKPNNSLNRSPR
jgi:hypothetical protein